jgi:hypothetical protein
LEETLSDFMKMTGQSINDVRSTTMVNTLAIAKLETQMGQLANHLGERDKGKLQSLPVPNPKAFTIGNSASQAHEHEQMQSIITFRSRTQVDNKVVQEEEDPVVLQGKESGRGNGEKLSLLELYPLLRIP